MDVYDVAQMHKEGKQPFSYCSNLAVGNSIHAITLERLNIPEKALQGLTTTPPFGQTFAFVS